LFVTGTDTGVGKTVLSALLVSALDACYWKPIQTGVEGTNVETDTETVLRCARIDPARTFPECYRFAPALSPHLAARLAGVSIDLRAIARPPGAGDRRLIIEGAGGVLVPVTDRDLMIDVMRQHGAPVVVATRTTLGTINHTLLTLGALSRAELPIVGVVMIGDANRDNREAIERYGGAPVVGWIPTLRTIDRASLDAVFDRHFDETAFRVIP
jgi:dethiobiotin synthetase